MLSSRHRSSSSQDTDSFTSKEDESNTQNSSKSSEDAYSFFKWFAFQHDGMTSRNQDAVKLFLFILQLHILVILVQLYDGVAMDSIELGKKRTTDFILNGKNKFEYGVSRRTSAKDVRVMIRHSQIQY